MIVTCGPVPAEVIEVGDVHLAMMSRPNDATQGRLGGSFRETVRRSGVVPSPLAWDFALLALAVIGWLLSLVAASRAGLEAACKEARRACRAALLRRRPTTQDAQAPRSSGLGIKILEKDFRSGFWKDFELKVIRFC